MNITDEELRAEAMRRVNDSGWMVTNDPNHWAISLLVTAMREQPWVPEPPVDEATLCWRETSAKQDPRCATNYLNGKFDYLKGKRFQAMVDALNWAKEREKQDAKL